MRLLLQSIVSLASQWRWKTVMFVIRALLKISKHHWIFRCFYLFIKVWEITLCKWTKICTFLVYWTVVVFCLYSGTCGRMTHHKLSGKKLLSHAETEKVNNNSRWVTWLLSWDESNVVSCGFRIKIEPLPYIVLYALVLVE